MSTRETVTSAPGVDASMRARAASPLASLRTARITAAPLRASASATSVPRPLEAPVTIAVRPAWSGMLEMVQPAILKFLFPACRAQPIETAEMGMGMAEPQPQGLARLDVERLGSRGEGVALRDGRSVYVPYALPGEVGDGRRLGRARNPSSASSRPSADRIAPICAYFGTCGGCAVQTLAAPAYAALEARPSRRCARARGRRSGGRAARRCAWGRASPSHIPRADRGGRED